MRTRVKEAAIKGLRSWIEYVSDLLGKKPEIGVELGTFEGQGSRILAEYCDHIICIDPYISYRDRIGSKKRLTKAKLLMLEELKNVNNISFINKTSKDASLLFDNFIFDFVYIDANHNYEYVLEDIKLWKDKCRVLGGHDYDKTFPGTIRAVDEMAKKLNKEIKTFEDSSWVYI